MDEGLAEFLRDMLKDGDFLAFVANKEDWFFVFCKIREKYFPNIGDNDVDLGAVDLTDSTAIYWIRISKVNLTDLSRRLGLPMAVLKPGKVLEMPKLERWQRVTPLPPPSVAIYGEA